MNLDILETIDGYRQYFMDPGLWDAYVRQVYRRHFSAPIGCVRPGLAGTYPTFIIDQRWVVKFFGRLFDGSLSFETELEAAQLLSTEPGIPAPALAAWGELLSGPGAWPWPYLIYEFIPGVSFGEVYDNVPLEEKLILARDLGQAVHHIHCLPLSGARLFRPDWEPYVAFLQAQRLACAANHRQWGSLPARLVDQIDEFLVPVADLVERSSPPYLIHADLTGDHLLGRLEGGRWTTLGLIDFGDAMIGDLFYELIALHLDLFRGDKRLLRIFLEAYNPPASLLQNFAARAMTATLLHRFDVLVLVFSEARPEMHAVASLEELADSLWDF